MPKYQVFIDGELDDEIFDTEEAANEYGMYLQCCDKEGAETLHLSNPGDYEYDEDDFESSDFTIVEVDD